MTLLHAGRGAATGSESHNARSAKVPVITEPMSALSAAELCDRASGSSDLLGRPECEPLREAPSHVLE
jgi:hypothetical protein